MERREEARHVIMQDAQERKTQETRDCRASCCFLERLGLSLGEPRGWRGSWWLGDGNTSHHFSPSNDDALHIRQELVNEACYDHLSRPQLTNQLPSAVIFFFRTQTPSVLRRVSSRVIQFGSLF